MLQLLLVVSISTADILGVQSECCSAFLQLCAQYLHVFIFDLLTSGDTIGDVEVDELWWQVHCSGKSGDTFTTQVSNSSKHCPHPGEACT